LTAISKFGIKAIFFWWSEADRQLVVEEKRKFYASLGPNIENNEIHITVQGQTISSNFGTLDLLSIQFRKFIECWCD
jgi:phosphoenolpyruvate carboxylase